MNSEIHVTIEGIEDSSVFREICNELGVKPLVIQNFILNRQEFVTSSANVPMLTIVAKFEECGYEVVRKKVEINKDCSKALYYEFHEERKKSEGCQSTVLNLNTLETKFFKTERVLKYKPGWETVVYDTNPSYDGMKIPERKET